MPDDPQLVRWLNSALPRERRRPVIQEATKDVLAADTVESLQALSNGAYSYRVTNSLTFAHEDMWLLYLHPALIRRTHAALLRKRTAELRSEERRSTTASTGRQRSKRVKAFLDLIEARIDQVEIALGDSALETQRRTINLLQSAIIAHRNASEDNDVIPEPWDEQLWQVAEQITPIPVDPADRTA